MEAEEEGMTTKRRHHPHDFSALDPPVPTTMPSLLSAEYREIEMIKHDMSGVNNQHHVKGGRRACIGISVLVLYHLYRRLTSPNRKEGDAFIPSVKEWNILLERGVELYDVWYQQQPVTPEKFKVFPTVEEVLALEECEPFRSLFKEAPVEVSGLVRKTSVVENTEGSLTALFIRMRREASALRRPVCALVVIPVAVCISVLCRPEPVGKECSFFVFDSHGGSGKNDALYCELTQFFMARDTAAYMIQKYAIESIANVDPEYLSYCTEEEIVSTYSYHARLFK